MNLQPIVGSGPLLPPVRSDRRIELQRPLNAAPGAVLRAIEDRLSRIGGSCRVTGPFTLEFDGGWVQGFIGSPILGGTVTLDLASPGKAALQVEVRLDGWRTYGWALAVALALALVWVPNPVVRLITLLGLLAVAVKNRNDVVQAIDGVVREATRRRARHAARLAPPLTLPHRAPPGAGDGDPIRATGVSPFVAGLERPLRRPARHLSF